MNRTTIIIILAAILVVVVGIISYSYSQKRKNSISIKTQQGTVTTKNFINSAKYNFSTTSIIESTDNYSISSYLPDGSFNISIDAAPVQAARDQAEKTFLKDLNISTADACKLNVTLGVTINAAPNLAGTNYGLSFCPNGVAFPASAK